MFAKENLGERRIFVPTDFVPDHSVPDSKSAGYIGGLSRFLISNYQNLYDVFHFVCICTEFILENNMGSIFAILII